MSELEDQLRKQIRELEIRLATAEGVAAILDINGREIADVCNAQRGLIRSLIHLANLPTDKLEQLQLRLHDLEEIVLRIGPPTSNSPPR